MLDRFLRIGEPGLGENEEDRVRAVRLAWVLKSTPWMMAANIGNAIVTIGVFRKHEMFPLVAVWAALVISIGIVTGLSWLRLRTQPPRRRASLRGNRRAVFYALLLSALWALLAATLYPAANDDQKLVVVALTVGMAAGGGVAMATIPPATIVWGVVIGAGAAVALARSPEMVGLSLMTLYCIFFAMVIRTSLAICEGLTERVRSQLAASEQRDVIGLLLNDFEENATDWLWGLDRDLVLRRASPRFFELLQVDPAVVIGRPFRQVLPLLDGACHALDNCSDPAVLEDLLRSRRPFRDLEFCVSQGDMLRIWSLSAKPFEDETGAFAGYRGVARDVTATCEARREIEHMARHDPLTDVGNRTLLNERLDLALRQMQRSPAGFSILLLDLDRFKQVNDAYGHGAGDELLKAVAHRIRASLDGRDLVARLGGDEFVIIHWSATTQVGTAELCERLIHALSEPFQLGASTVRIGVSIGIARAPADGRDGDTLMRHADLALYRAKSDGRNRYRFFDKSLDSAARRRNLLEAELREAVMNEGLTLYYQPLLDAETESVICFEALLRWHHPILGPVTPAEFIPIAEDAGLISELGAWTVRQACKTAAGWPDHVRVAVNLSPKQFSSPSVFVAARAALAESGLAPPRLELEVTESLLLNSAETIEATLQALRNLGIRIALDDFGTGYSSLSYLRRYRFDKLKIDKSFVCDLEDSAESRAIVEAVIRLGRTLGISLVAEGVETRGQFHVLKTLGCEEVQGYLFGEPRPADEIGRYFIPTQTTAPKPGISA